MLYSWSAENDLLTLQSDFTGTTNDVSFTNTFSPAHQWATSTISNASYRYAPLATYTNTFASNGANQVDTVNGSAMSYDARGNYRGSQASPVLAYDAENHLVSSATNTTSYTFDPMNRRTSRTSSGTTINFLHDGESEIAEYDAGGTLIRRFIPGPALNDYIAMVTVSGTKTFVHTDKMGSTVAMSDMSGNLVEGPYYYDPYGVCYTGGAYCSAGLPFKYTGQRLDTENGCVYYHARNYCPGFGRFSQTDPVGYKDDLNLYTYVAGDPTDKTDPTGKMMLCFGVNDCFDNGVNRLPKRQMSGAVGNGATPASQLPIPPAPADPIPAKVEVIGNDHQNPLTVFDLRVENAAGQPLPGKGIKITEFIFDDDHVPPGDNTNGQAFSVRPNGTFSDRIGVRPGQPSPVGNQTGRKTYHQSFTAELNGQPYPVSTTFDHVTHFNTGVVTANEDKPVTPWREEAKNADTVNCNSPSRKLRLENGDCHGSGNSSRCLAGVSDL